MAINVNIQPNKNSAFLWGKVLPAVTREGNTVRWVVLEGSSRSGKTWSILQFLIALCMRPELLGRGSITVRVYRHDATTTSGSVVEDFREIMTRVFGGDDGSGEWVSLWTTAGLWNSTAKRFAFANGSSIQFLGADEKKAHGKKATISWLNEVMEITDASRRQISARTELFMICDFNPSNTDHWLFDTVMKRKEWLLYCHSTYKDNAANLEPKQIWEIEATEPTPENIRNGTANPWFWQVYGLGQRGAREGQVFPRIHWDLCDDFPIQSVCQRFGFALDFGFSQDPTALVECAVRDDNIYVRQIVYERNLLIGRNAEDPRIPSLQARMEDAQVSKTTRIVADSARPDLIATLRACGYNCIPCEKTHDGINYGLNLMRQFRIYIDRSSIDIQREFENYAYKRASDGRFTDEPEDRNNHAIDAIRYWVMDNLRPRLVLPRHFKPRTTYDSKIW